jgi:hypothetical protein
MEETGSRCLCWLGTAWVTEGLLRVRLGMSCQTLELSRDQRGDAMQIRGLCNMEGLVGSKTAHTTFFPLKGPACKYLSHRLPLKCLLNRCKSQSNLQMEIFKSYFCCLIPIPYCTGKAEFSWQWHYVHHGQFNGKKCKFFLLEKKWNNSRKLPGC